MEDDCEHERTKLRMDTSGLDELDGDHMPRYFTVPAECECGEVVEADFEFDSKREK